MKDRCGDSKLDFLSALHHRPAKTQAMWERGAGHLYSRVGRCSVSDAVAMKEVVGASFGLMAVLGVVPSVNWDIAKATVVLLRRWKMVWGSSAVPSAGGGVARRPLLCCGSSLCCPSSPL